jgi:endogenous inhibitor of DNA gyrase (YacG/DUF329 family)
MVMTALPRTCPICKKAAAPRAKNSTFPFCSARCKTVDLGKWLSEDYRVAGPPAESEATPTDERDDERVKH